MWNGNLSTLGLASDKNIVVTVPANSPIKIQTKYKQPLIAPIKEGDDIGELVITTPGFVEKTYKLKAVTTVNKINILGKIIENLKHYLTN